MMTEIQDLAGVPLGRPTLKKKIFTSDLTLILLTHHLKLLDVTKIPFSQRNVEVKKKVN